MKRVYLDYAAATPCRPEVIEAMRPYFDEKFGNPSAIHSFGQEAKSAIEAAREKVAAVLGAKPEEIVFTSGGTEADNLALTGTLLANEHRGNHIVTSTIEHNAVLQCCKFLERRGYQVTYLAVDKFGLVDPSAVRKAITDKTVLVSIMHANNEVGTVEPIAEIGKIVKEKGIYFHTDAVQTFGHLPTMVDELDVDLLAVSAHKLYGPKGIGALYLRKGTRISPLIYGGGQEKGRRASTENVPAIVGFGVAAELALQEMDAEAKRLTSLRDKLIKGIQAKIDQTCLNGHPSRRLPNNANLCIEFIEGESILINLDYLGIAASTGSACSSNSLEPSHVLLALGHSHELAHGSLRFTIGKYTTEKEVDYFLEVLPGIAEKLRAMSPLYKK